MQRPTCYPQALASFVLTSLHVLASFVLASLYVLASFILASCTYSHKPCVRICMHSREPCAGACVTLVCLDAHLHSCTSAIPSNTLHSKCASSNTTCACFATLRNAWPCHSASHSAFASFKNQLNTKNIIALHIEDTNIC